MLKILASGLLGVLLLAILLSLNITAAEAEQNYSQLNTVDQLIAQADLRSMIDTNLGDVKQTSGLPNPKRGIQGFVIGLLRVLIGLTGLIFLIMIISGGIQWMTAGGNPDRVRDARSRIVNGVIGLFIVFAALGVVIFIFNVFGQAGDFF